MGDDEGAIMALDPFRSFLGPPFPNPKRSTGKIGVGDINQPAQAFLFTFFKMTDDATKITHLPLFYILLLLPSSSLGAITEKLTGRCST
jgi:hypothetical protein